MNYNPESNTANQNMQENNLNVRDLIDKYLSHWKWFLLSLIICVSFALYKLNFSRYKFEASSSIKIKDEESGDATTLSALKDLSMVTGPKQNVDDEIEILGSKSLISETIKSLNLNVLFFEDKNNFSSFLDNYIGLSTDFFEVELYKNSPIKVNFLVSDSIISNVQNRFIIDIKSDTRFVFVNSELDVNKSYAFGEKITTSFGDIIVTPNSDLKEKKYIGKKIQVSIAPINDLITAYKENLKIEPKSELSSVLNLRVVDGNKLKAEDFLNTLVQKYNDRAMRLKEELTKSTSDFVSNRLLKISDELNNVDLTAESIKTRYKMSDVASETGLNMESGRILENQIVQVSTDLEKIKYIKDEITTDNTNKLIPNIEVGDQNAAGFKEKYNELMLEKQRLLKTSTERNPTVVNITEQLDALKNNYVKSLDNIENTYKISLDALNQQSSRISSKLYSAPRQERQIRDIQRQQQIKESLYLYLLQKREETAITLGVSDPNAEIIDIAQASVDSVAPKKKTTVLVAGFLGMLFPILFIYLADLLDSKIHTREEVERMLNIPVIADIPKLPKLKGRYLIKKDDYSPAAEAFRILRTNLNFILPQKNNEEKGKTIFITSTIAHEGKSLVSSNLATSLAHANKKTILLGMDIRAPKIKEYLGVKGKIGVTNYIINDDLTLNDIVVKVHNSDNLDLISSGDIAPNPAELLMSNRVNELFDKLKENYEYIIVDTAAFSLVTDTLLLSKFADAFIYVIRTNFLDKRGLKYIKSLNFEKKLPNMSLLINGIDYKKIQAGNYGYGYGYGKLSDESKKRKWWRLR